MCSRLTLFTLCLAASLFATTTTATERQEPVKGRRGGESQAQRHSTERWWRNPEMRRQLGLTKQQQDKIDAISVSTRPEIETLYGELRKRETTLDTLLAKSDADESTVFAAIDRVEHVRYEINRSYVFMVYRMHRCLTPEQRAALTKIAADRRPQRQR